MKNQFGFDSIFSVGTNKKTILSDNKTEYLTAIQYKAPYKTSGYNACAMAKIAGCENACLYRNGNGNYSRVQTARINRTRCYFEHREAYMELLYKAIDKFLRKCDKLGKKPCIRLNGTSDINYIPTGIFDKYSHVQFYDYTKIVTRFKSLPENYDLTFSWSNASPRYQKDCNIAMNSGYRLAMVFRDKSTLPETFNGRPIVDGNIHDATFLRPKNAILALTGAGVARSSDTGFVINNLNAAAWQHKTHECNLLS